MNSKILSKETLVPIGFVIVIVAGVLWLNTRLMRIEFRLRVIEEQVTNAMDDRWRSGDMRLWAEQLRRKNPSLDVPEPVPHGRRK